MRRRPILPTLLALAIVATEAVAGQFLAPMEAAARAAAFGPGRHDHLMDFGGFRRRFVVQVPRSYKAGRPAPVVILLHGSMGSAESLLNDANWSAESERGGFLVLAPEGLPMRPRMPAASIANPRVWNSGQYAPNAPRSAIDDVAFIMAALDHVAKNWRIDPEGVYIAGHSNGGAMAFRLAAERADRIAAIASVGGLNWVARPKPSRPVPTLFIVGTNDPLVPLDGGLKVLPWEIKSAPAVGAVLDEWAAAIGCTAGPTPVASSDPSITVAEYRDADGPLVRAVSVLNQGHAWPGSRVLRPERLLGPDLTNFDATAAIWSTFREISR